LAENFYTLITKTGQAQIANATALGTKITFKTLKVGDGNGSYYDPTEVQTDLVHTVWSGDINSINVDPNNDNWIVIQAIIPSSDGDFTVREMGVYDENNHLLAISKVAETYKPVITDGSTKELLMKMVIAVTNTSSINLKIDPTLVFATKSDLNNLTTIITNEINDINFQTATGTGTAITLTLQTLVDGYSKTFIASADNGSLATTVNGKSLYRPNTTTSPKLVKGKAYTIWYNLAKDCFFIKASAEGTATKDCVLAGYTFSSDDVANENGTIVSNGALNYSLPINGTFNIPSGFTTGGAITQTIPTKPAQTYLVSTIDQIISLGQYLTGNQVIKGYPDLKPENIVNGKGIGGITGTATVQTLGGIQIKSGTVTNVQDPYGIVDGLTFTPSIIIMYYGGGSPQASLPWIGVYCSQLTGNKYTVTKMNSSDSNTNNYTLDNTNIYYGGFKLPLSGINYNYSPYAWKYIALG
jgi:hypothetical protein